MSDYKTNKPPVDDDLKSIAEHLSERPEKLDMDFWKQYFYWAWRSVLFVLFIVLATNLDFRDDKILSLDHVSSLEWTLVFLLGFLGTAIFVGWSLIWACGHELLGRFRS